ncbi:N-carbamoyl-D-amino acid hydrolase [Paraburkholderia nemoris]|uniref:nitrilase family protein n=1 Tax=Paraburkholderia nemoris TaxID=2793076 RepID=UPI00190BCDD2|nr:MULTISPECIES: nitrilase family protein [Paraburkholderia]MBK3741604.1 hydratase [Paraburkholderia aspalathi]MBK3782222.1 hydratase [Paraburkholderia aspalathi]CAE6735933.1 N-carbamoyl-D-amino acid hydrolase [Paraburkholderia nemoris]CAE6752481.1 N-carbamoyl-D-amino acid hydrolase [Paraburkholderia nemoris]CAE6799191.1 N-carbamoyl-D-amino acid hydrolase [Paraburkholderia nemoris]
MMTLQYNPAERGVAGLVVACVQMEPHVGSKHDNVAQCIRHIEAAAHHGASLVVLPELANSGYVFSDRDEAFALAEPLPEGETAQLLAETTQRLGIHVVMGIAERSGNQLYNSAILTGPAGHIGVYRKLHLWNNEHRFFEPGDRGVPVFDTPLGRIAIAICYDGWFPETYRLAAMQGADIVCVPTNWVPMPAQPDDRPAMATTLTMAAAHSNGVVIACANRIGMERGQPFVGQSLIVGGNGWPVAGPASVDREEILYAAIDLTRTRSERTLNAFNHVLSDRRADVYDPMLGTGWPPSRA